VTVIRPLRRGDLLDAATLYDIGFRDGSRPADPAIATLLERILFDNPWADPELSSLLATDDGGRAIGLIGASPRRMLLGGRPVRVVVVSHLVVDPAARDPLAAPRLLRQLLAGPQDATVTDTATETVRRIWIGLGARMRHVECIEWIRVFRPWAIAAWTAGRRRTRRPERLRSLAAALDVPTVAVASRYLRPAPVAHRTAALTPGALVEQLPAVTDHLELFASYDVTFLDWLFREATRAYRDGTIVRNVVFGSDGRTVGWYVYLLRPDSVSEVLQVAATERGVDHVLDEMLAHAWRHGSAALRGRLEPALVEPVSRRRCVLRYAGRALIHSRDVALLQAVATGGALLSKLDGEWWFESAAGWR
jgi:hypothetical protein